MQELVRSHKEEGKGATTEMAATKRATTEEAGSNMKRYDEILERFKECDDGDKEE